MDQPGLVTIGSRYTVKETLDRLEAALTAKAITVFARIDHAAGAAQVGLSLRPTTVIIFGNPAAGTPLMQADQRVGLDLPLKVLVWEDQQRSTWLTYSDPRLLTERYGLASSIEPAVKGLAGALAALSRAATGS